MSGARWTVRFRPRPEARLRLFCVPFAGGGASAFATWSDDLPPSIEVCAVQLPGREGRFIEPLFTDVHALVPELSAALGPLLDRPFAFFGHSLGAAIAYETALALTGRGHGAPSALFVSGHGAPQLPRRERPIHDLPEAELVEELRRLNGTPAEVFAGPELLALVLPQLRADFQMAETYAPSRIGGLACPVVALGSTEDDRVSVATLEPWSEVTKGPFAVKMFPGDHFYVKSQRGALLQFLTGQLAPLAR